MSQHGTQPLRVVHYLYLLEPVGARLRNLHLSLVRVHHYFRVCAVLLGAEEAGPDIHLEEER